MKALIEKHPALMDRRDPGELQCQKETIQAKEECHYIPHIN